MSAWVVIFFFFFFFLVFCWCSLFVVRDIRVSAAAGGCRTLMFVFFGCLVWEKDVYRNE